eukprot:gene8320-43828_t
MGSGALHGAMRRSGSQEAAQQTNSPPRLHAGVSESHTPQCATSSMQTAPELEHHSSDTATPQLRCASHEAAQQTNAPPPLQQLPTQPQLPPPQSPPQVAQVAQLQLLLDQQRRDAVVGAL